MDQSTDYNLPWDRTLETGITWIDDQHKQLLGNLVNAASAIAEKKSDEKIRVLISFLNEYVRSHFKVEQNYMQRFNYPQITDHLEQHRLFIAKCKDSEVSYILHGPSRKLAVEITRDLWDWFKIHICKYDKKLAVFMKVRKAQADRAHEAPDGSENV